MSVKKPVVVEGSILLPFIFVTLLFFLWGVPNDLTNPMVAAFKKVMPELSNVEASLIQLAFYGGYGTMAIPAALFIRKYSYKSGIIVGLLFFAAGSFLFIPAAAYEKFSFFLISLYILTFGLAFLETTANPMVLSMGPKETATQRLNLSQAFNPMGALSGQLIAKFFVVDLLQSSRYSRDEYLALEQTTKESIRQYDLHTISETYIAIGIIVAVLMVIFVFLRIDHKEEHSGLTVKASLTKLFSNKNYYEGVMAQFFYVGAQILCWTFIYQYVDNMNESRSAEERLEPFWFSIGATTCFLIARWICTYLFRFISAPKLMFYFSIFAVFFCAGAILLPGMAGLYSLVGISFAMSLMFPTIYGIALKGMGDEAKLGSAGMILAIVGGALLPPIQGWILDWGGPSLNDKNLLGYIPEVNFSYIVPMICLVMVGRYSWRSMNRGV